MSNRRSKTSLKEALLFGAFLAFLPGCEFRSGWSAPEATPVPSSYVPTIHDEAQLDRPTASPSPDPNKPQQAGVADPDSLNPKKVPREGPQRPSPKPSPVPSPVPSPEPSPTPEPSPSPDPTPQDYSANNGGVVDPNAAANPPSIMDAAQNQPPQDPNASPAPQPPSADEPQLNVDPSAMAGSGDGLSVPATPPLSPDELQQKFFDYLAGLTDLITGDYVYATDSDVAGAASKLVTAQIDYEQFVATQDYLRNLWDEDSNDYIFRGTTAVDKAQDVCARKVKIDPLKQSVDYFKTLMDRERNFLLTMPQVILLSIEVNAQPTFSLETFANDYSQDIIVEEAAILAIQNVLVRENVTIDWGKVTAGIPKPNP